jgi:hypothetical protein
VTHLQSMQRRRCLRYRMCCSTALTTERTHLRLRSGYLRRARGISNRSAFVSAEGSASSGPDTDRIPAFALESGRVHTATTWQPQMTADSPW